MMKTTADPITADVQPASRHSVQAPLQGRGLTAFSSSSLHMSNRLAFLAALLVCLPLLALIAVLDFLRRDAYIVTE